MSTEKDATNRVADFPIFEQPTPPFHSLGFFDLSPPQTRHDNPTLNVQTSLSAKESASNRFGEEQCLLEDIR
jgi:hypothetical protein